MTLVATSRAIRYSAVGFIAHVYGRHILRVLRHPTQHWGWFALFAAIFAAVVAATFFINRRSAEPTAQQQETVRA